jgi:hypothetical protein
VKTHSSKLGKSNGGKIPVVAFALVTVATSKKLDYPCFNTINMYSPNNVVSQIREASRLLLGDLGFMSLTLAGTQNPKPSAVQAVMEIGYCTSISASLQSKTLKLDRSDISRMLAK